MPSDDKLRRDIRQSEKQRIALRLAHNTGRGLGHSEAVALAEAFCELWDELDTTAEVPNPLGAKSDSAQDFRQGGTQSVELLSEPTPEMIAAVSTILQPYAAKLVWKRMLESAPRSATVSSEDAACKVAADLLRNEIVRLDYPKSMFPQEAEKIGRRQAAFQEAVHYLDPADSGTPTNAASTRSAKT